jgi:arsenite methyltransferase
MTDEMLDLARANAADSGVESLEFVKGYLEDLPLADETADVVMHASSAVVRAPKPAPRGGLPYLA